MADYHPDDLLPDLADLVAELTAPAFETAQGLEVEEITVDLPVELQLLDDTGAVGLQASAPTQQVETSVLPVWHRLRMTIRQVRDA